MKWVVSGPSTNRFGAPRRQRMKLDQEKRQFNDVLGYLHREIFTCEVHLKQVEKDLIGASKVMQVSGSAWKLNLTPSTRVGSIRRARGWSLVQI